MRTGTGPIHRRSERIHLKIPTDLRVDSDPQSVKHTASIIDLSDRGARICTGAGLVIGQTIAINPDEGSGRSISGRVVWVGPIGSPLEDHAGIEFLRPLPISS